MTSEQRGAKAHPFTCSSGRLGRPGIELRCSSGAPRRPTQTPESRSLSRRGIWTPGGVAGMMISLQNGSPRPDDPEACGWAIVEYLLRLLC